MIIVICHYSDFLMLANPDPLTNIIGSSFHGSENKLLVDVHDKLARYSVHSITKILSIIVIGKADNFLHLI